MSFEYADQATKALAKATPTVDLEGNVIKWEVEVQYSLNGYKSVYRDTIEQHEFEPKAPEEFTKEELMTLSNYSQFDRVFDSQYASVMLPPTEVRVSDFNINQLG